MARDASDNLVPLKPRLSTRATRLLGMVEAANDLEPVLERDYLVKGWIDRGTLTVLYGDANAGKSFAAIDLAHCVREGIAWGGYKVSPGPVLYIAAEGGAVFQNRLAARKARFLVMRHQIALTGRNPDAPPLAEAVRHLAEIEGEPFRLVIVDTLARAMGGGDENTAPDIAALVNGCGVIQHQTGAAVLLVHHSGKDAARGARGHSALRAAVDTELCVTVEDDGWRTIKATKQRDWPGGKDMRFKLSEVTLGRDRDGDAVTSCVVQHEVKGGRLI
jgi:RecA-family ATPase